MRQFVELQREYQSFIFIADYHALTTVQNRAEMEENILGVTLDYLAIGLDPAIVTLYKQSDVGLATELAWIFDCLTTMPYLRRAHAFKDAQAKNEEINVGVFNYPMLMAADILLFRADAVPVGQDQKQHVEIARDTAEKFNHLFGHTFKLPEPIILPQVETVLGTDGRKMSKSYGNVIPLFAEDKEIRQAVMSIVTDSKEVEESKDPDKCNVFALHKLVSAEQLPELTRRYRKGGIGYKESKEMLIENMIKYFKPMHQYRQELAENAKEVYKILAEGGEKARAMAEETMRDIRQKIGVA